MEKKLIIKVLPYRITGGVCTISKGLAYDTYNYKDNKVSEIFLTSHYFEKFINLN